MAHRDGYDAMPEPVAVEAVEETTADLAEELSELLGNLVALKFQAHGYHWNVKGPMFAQFHELFGDIYADVDDTIDPMQEQTSGPSKPDFVVWSHFTQDIRSLHL
jgi:DNA-binding ferritin-like protein